MSRNPSRGCGKKVEDSCYGESPDEAPGGILKKWAWVLGDGFNDIVQLEIPPRMMVKCNPAGTLAARELVTDAEPVFVKGSILAGDYDPGKAYQRLLRKTKRVGVADHIGQQYYSPYSFYKEGLFYGLSRKIPPRLAAELAAVIWQTGPVPMLFTHSRMPVFKSYEHLREGVDLVAACLEDQIPIDPDVLEWTPTWELEDWSQYTSEPGNGDDHVLAAVLYVLDQIERNWEMHEDHEAYRLAHDFFKFVQYAEQAFGLGWLGKVTYTADKDGNFSSQALQQQDAYNGQIVDLLDLREEENA